MATTNNTSSGFGFGLELMGKGLLAYVAGFAAVVFLFFSLALFA
nr:hypothetical protein [uncultured Pseudodesulfovibrio sp.]